MEKTDTASDNHRLNDLPTPCVLRQLGLNPAEVTGGEILHRKHGNRLYRITCGGRSFVLKWFGDPARSTEVRSYALLEGLGVPTLPVHGRVDNAFLPEDLTASSRWRLAEEADVQRPETGAAVAEWYLTLHAAGREMLADPAAEPDFLKREVDELDAGSILETARQLGLSDNPVWELAAVHIVALKSAMCALAETLNYSDFHWTNLALSHRAHRAVVFDYHLLGIGLRYSDCRNVAGSLDGKARSAFWETYGPLDETERVLDEPTAVLYALKIASERPTFPAWARGCLNKIRSGELERSLRYTLEVIQE